MKDTWNARYAIAVAGWILRTFAPGYSKSVREDIEYVMRAAARDFRPATPEYWR